GAQPGLHLGRHPRGDGALAEPHHGTPHDRRGQGHRGRTVETAGDGGREQPGQGDRLGHHERGDQRTAGGEDERIPAGSGPANEAGVEAPHGYQYLTPGRPARNSRQLNTCNASSSGTSGAATQLSRRSVVTSAAPAATVRPGSGPVDTSTFGKTATPATTTGSAIASPLATTASCGRPARTANPAATSSTTAAPASATATAG